MKLKPFGIWSALALLVVATACTKTSPTRPSDVTASGQTASVTDAVTGVTLTSPSLVTPAVNQQFKNVEQPITLTIKNAVTSGTTALTYTFEVASDAAFATKVYTKAGVAAGSGDTTSLKIDRLTPDKAYFWRARATSGTLDGPYTDARGVGIGPEVILAQPVNGDPQPNATVGEQPTLNVNNVGRTGPAGPVFYRFEIAESESFDSLIYSATVSERTDRPFTGHDVTLKLLERTYFWRVIAIDPENGVTSAASGGSSMTVQPFNMSAAIIVNSPPDLGRWPETAKITSVDFTSNAFHVEFNRRTGPNRWPDVVPAGWAGALQYTLGMCVKPSGQWYCSAVVQFWAGRDLGDSAPPHRVGIEWFYDLARWGPILGYQPRNGETVGLFVGAGNLRDGGNFTQASCPRVCERSNVAFVQWGSSASF